MINDYQPTIDSSASQLPPNTPNIYDLPSSQDHLRFFSGGINPYTPPVLHFPTVAPPEQSIEQNDDVFDGDQDTSKHYFLLKHLLPDDFRHRRYRRKLWAMNTMNLLANVRHRINKGRSPSQQHGIDGDDGDTNSLPHRLSSFSAYTDDPDFTLADARAHLGLLLRMTSMDSDEYTKMEQQIYELEMDHVEKTLKWKQKMEMEAKEIQQLKKAQPSASISHRNTQADQLFSSLESVDTDRFLDALDSRNPNLLDLDY